MTYEVKLLASEEGYAVWCPALPGCASQGATESEALENIKDAIQEYLATDLAEGLAEAASVQTRLVDVA